MDRTRRPYYKNRGSNRRPEVAHGRGPAPEFNRPAPVFNRPEIIGFMSVDGNRDYRCDLSELRFVNRLPETPECMDLNQNIDKAVKRTTKDNVEKIDLMLRFILDKGSYLDLSHEFTFVTYRRSLLDVMCKAWPGLDPCRIGATLFDGCIYLCSLKTDEQAAERENWSERDKTMCAWGYKFEQLVTSELPNEPTAIDQPVVENAEFSLYLRTTFGSHRLVYGAQIDGTLAKPDTPPPPPAADFETTLRYLRDQQYIELKTNRLITSPHHEINYKRRKLLYCWGQCYLGGLLGLVVGLRDDSGRVRRIQRLNTPDIVQYCQDQWSPEGPLSFLDYFLNFVKNHFKSELKRLDINDVTSVGPITAQFDIQIDRDRSITVSEGQPILPQWYVEERRKQMANLK